MLSSSLTDRGAAHGGFPRWCDRGRQLRELVGHLRDADREEVRGDLVVAGESEQSATYVESPQL